MRRLIELLGTTAWRIAVWAERRLEVSCRHCGCTDMDCMDCMERTGEPCHWVERDLCSACAAADR